MKRRTSIYKTIPRFIISVDEISELQAHIEEMFSMEMSQIDIVVGDTSIHYNDPSEFARHRGWDQKIKRFSFDFSQKRLREGETEYDKRAISIRGGKDLAANSIYVYSTDAAWAQGAVDQLKQRMRSYQAWYRKLPCDAHLSFVFTIATAALLAASMNAAYVYMTTPISAIPEETLYIPSWFLALSGIFSVFLTWLMVKRESASKIKEKRNNVTTTILELAKSFSPIIAAIAALAAAFLR